MRLLLVRDMRALGLCYALFLASIMPAFGPRSACSWFIACTLVVHIVLSQCSLLHALRSSLALGSLHWFRVSSSQISFTLTSETCAGWTELSQDVSHFVESGSSPLTKLVPDLAGIDPDDAFSLVPYEKGFNLLYALQTLVGDDVSSLSAVHFDFTRVFAYVPFF